MSLVQHGGRDRCTSRSHAIAAVIVTIAALVAWTVGPRLEPSVARAAVPSGCALAGTSTFSLTGSGASAPFSPGTGTLPAVMLFADFSDAPGATAAGAAESPSVLYDTYVPPARSWFTTASGGRFDVTIATTTSWLRMPKRSDQYGFADGLTFAEHQRLLQDAITTAGNLVPANVALVYVVTSVNPSMTGSAAFHGVVGNALRTTSNREILGGVTLGNDLRFGLPGYGSMILVHETLHRLGLPDLYAFDAGYPEIHRFVGSWDPMGWVANGANPMAWQEAHLGWIDAAQLVCTTPGTKRTYTLSPVGSSAAGTKAIVVKTGPTTAIVAENRQAVGVDQRLAGTCDRGMLVYRVDAAALTGRGPVQVQRPPGVVDDDSDRIQTCGLLYAATFDARPGKSDTYVDPTTGTSIRVVTTSAGGDLVVEVVRPATVPPAGDGVFVGVSPERLLDTRPESLVGFAGAKPVAGDTIALQITGVGAGQVPPVAGAVALNVTGVDPTDDGFVTVWPCDQPRPNTSSLNLRRGITTPNAVVSKLSAAGTVCLFTQSGTHLVVDVSGYVNRGSSFVAVQPDRLLDTRPESLVGASGERPGVGASVRVQVVGAGAGSVPAAARSVLANVTGVAASAAGFVTAWPCDAPRPTASTLNLAVVKLAADGSLCLFTQSGADLLVDVVGYTTDAATFRPVQPERILDTRAASGPIGHDGAGPGAGDVIEVQITGAGTGAVPPTATAVAVNVTGVEPGADGFVTVWPCGSPRPTASTLNLEAGQVAANLAMVKLGDGGRICLYTQRALDLVVDVSGYVV